MKILIVTGIYPPDIGGPATYSRTMAEELSFRGHSVTVISYGNPEKSSGFEVFGVSRKIPWFFRHAVFGIKVFFYVRKNDVIFAQDAMNSAVASMISARFWRKRCVVKIIGDYAWEQGVNRFGVTDLLDDFLDNKYGFFVEFLRWVESFVVKRFDAVITPSKYLKRVVSKWGVSPGKIKVIYNAVVVPKVFEDRSETRKRLNLSGPIILSVGRLVPWKGFEKMIEVTDIISKDYKNVKLIIVGEGPEYRKLKTRILEKGLQNNIILTGIIPHEKILSYLKASDVFVLNTGYEGFSHQILEAMMAGVPVISTNAGGNAEILEDGKNSLVVGYDNTEEIAKSVLRIFRDEQLAVSLTGNAGKIKGRFSFKSMVDETIKILKKMAD